MQSPDTLPVLLSFVDREARYAYVDEAYETWFGRPREEIEGRSVREVLGEAAWRDIRAYVERALSGESVTFEQRVSYAGVGPREVSVDYIPKRSESGEVEGFFAIVRDVRERRRLEQELRHAQKMEALGRMASSIAHDFRNLLAGIIGVTDLARDRVGADHPIQQHLDEIRRAARSGAESVRHLLSFAREEGPRRLPIPVDESIARQASMLRQLLSGGIDLRLSLGAPDAWMECGAGHLEQILMNLVLNARDAMPDGGTLRIETDTVHLSPTQLRYLGAPRPGAYARLIVTDTGHGMDERTLASALEPFFTTKEGGTGLGLSSVYGIVRACGGHVQLESHPGEGTRVEVLVPSGSAPVEAGEETRPSAPPPAATVLVVEDDRLVRMTTRHYLERHGYRVVEAADATEAMRMLETHGDISLAVVDVTLPRVSGPALVAQMEQAAPHLKVAYVSAHPKYVMVEEGRIDTDAITVEKPFTEEVLLEALAHAAPGGRARANERT